MEPNERTRKPLDERIANTCAIAAGILGALLAFYYAQFISGAASSPPEGLIAAWATPVALLALVKIMHCVADRVGRRHAARITQRIDELEKKIDQVNAAALKNAHDAGYFRCLAEVVQGENEANVVSMPRRNSN